MNVPKGYKMTEVGVIPEDWEVKAFADVVSLRKQRIDPCRNQSENYDFCIELENIESGSGQILGYSNLRDNASLKSVFYKDDVLFGKLRAYLRKYWLADREGLCSTEIWVFVSKTEQILPSYLFQTIQSKGFIDLAITAYGTHMPRSDWNVVKNYPLLTPPLPEQQAIARVLSDTDELINALDKLIAKKRDIKKAVMQELLTGKTRLPGFSGKWDYKKIGEFTDCVAGGTPNTTVESYWGGNIRWMSSGELHQRFVYDVEGRITEEGLKNSNTKIIPANCVLVGLAGQGKTRGTVALNKVPLCTNQSIAAIYPNDLFSSEYLFYNLDDRYEELRSLSTGSSGRGGLNLTIIRDVLVLFPEKNEQQAIAQVLSDMDREITALEQRRDKTKALKQGMMQALLTGRIRLPKGDTNDA